VLAIIARRKCARWSRSEKLLPEVSAHAIGSSRIAGLGRGPVLDPPSHRGDERWL